jgi:GT2 family glycosyltransferase
VRLAIKGEAIVKLAAMRLETSGQEDVASVHVENTDVNEVNLDFDFGKDEAHGFYYVSVLALSENVLIAAGRWTAESETVEKVKIAAVICTHKREEFVRSNINLVLDEIYDNKNEDSIIENVDFFIVDNGKTLSPDIWNNPHIKLFPNKNLGGSGGFTRGMIEALKCGDEYTHVLLMDDDIKFEPEIFTKTIRILQLRKPEYDELWVGSGMLQMDIPWRQFTMGERWVWGKLYNCQGLHRSLDLRNSENVLANEDADKPGYQAWWFAIIPITSITKNRLPLPFFIRNDDIEYGLRIHPEIIIINGCAVWHQDFNLKTQSYLEYYKIRNLLVMNALHDGKANAINQWLRIAFLVSYKVFLRYYQDAIMIFKGSNDFLQGATSLMSMNGEILHKRLCMEFKKCDFRTCRKNAWVLEFGLVPFLFKMFFLYRKVVDSYRKNFTQMTSLEFWKEKLELV